MTNTPARGLLVDLQAGVPYGVEGHLEWEALSVERLRTCRILYRSSCHAWRSGHRSMGCYLPEGARRSRSLRAGWNLGAGCHNCLQRDFIHHRCLPNHITRAGRKEVQECNGCCQSSLIDHREQGSDSIILYRHLQMQTRCPFHLK
jgi:hypothetical protein